MITLFFCEFFSLLSDLFVQEGLLFTKYIFIFSGFSLGSIMFLSNRQFVVIDKLTVCVILFTSYFLFVNSFDYPRVLGNLCLISFLFLYLFFKNYKLSGVWIGIIVAFLCLSQTIYGLLQYFHIIDLDSHFPILGSYDNPAGFAACLAISFPLCFSLFDSTKLHRLIAILSIIGTIIVIILSESRTGIVSVMIVVIVYVYRQLSKRSVILKKYLFVSILFLGIGIFITLLVLKKESAFGRVLIWEIALQMVKDNPLRGGGSGSFLANYMEYQADFFTHNPSNKYALLADNVLHPFNEYLLILVEYGVFAIILLVSLMIIIFRSAKISLSYMLCLLSLGIFSLFSYPLKYPFTWLIVAYSLAQINRMHESSSIIISVRKKIIKILCLFLILVGLIFLIRDIRFEYKWNEVVQKSLSGKIREVLPMYKCLYNSWNGNYLFLYNYGAELNRVQEYDKSIDLLKQCKQYWNDYDIQMLLADNYFNLKRWNDAELHYAKASHMCPNRFIPLYRLHRIYLCTNRKDKAMQMAQLLIVKEVKIESPIVNTIKKRMRKFILQYY